MTKKELKTVLKVLGKIKDPNAEVLEAIFIINKNIEYFNKLKGQLREQFDYDPGPY